MESLIGSKVSFAETEQNDLSQLPPLPNEIPKPYVTRENIGIDLSRSATLDAVISQNEDLMNRLKVALKRLSILESTNQALSEENNRFKLSFGSVKTQVDVYKEEAQEWRTQVQEKENENKRLTVMTNALDERTQKQAAELQRHIKFQEKIKTHVKPFLTELKSQNKNLEAQNQQLEAELAQKNSELSEVRDQLNHLLRTSREQIQLFERNLHETTRSYENQFELFQTEANSKQDRIQDLEDQVFRLQKRVERMDAIENDLVATQRLYEEVTTRYKSEVERLQSEGSTIDKKLNESELLTERFKQEVKSLQNQKFELETRAANQQEQLDSLRRMWSDKCDEIENVKKSMNALERLNLELSSQLHRDRQARNPSQT